jgi:UDP-2-acetamido-2-deoxy-ribo-hexuluronate aminotransferase
MEIQMVDLNGQYLKIKKEVDKAIQNVIDASSFINGSQVNNFSINLGKYLKSEFVVTCGNGTDALQIALMSLGLQQDDEVIVPSFGYVAAVEVIALLRLKPVMVEVDPNTFMVTAKTFKNAITGKTKAIIPIHLFGQCADMENIMKIAQDHGIFVVEDTAQAIGADYTFSDGTVKKAGTIGNIGCTSFFPSKNLGCFGDGGAIYTDDEALAMRCRMIANHGQSTKYYHTVVGLNSRLDSIQAGILGVKLEYIDIYKVARQYVASTYDNAFGNLDWITIPKREIKSTHVFHQYTLKLNEKVSRDHFREYLNMRGIPSMVYYPMPMHLQDAYSNQGYQVGDFPISEELAKRVISLPIHTEMDENQLDFITSTIKSYE